jgi:hypothetical protein
LRKEPLDVSPDERALYDEISTFVRENMKSKENEPEEDRQDSPAWGDTITLQTLQREVGSSPRAVESTLRALAEQRRMQPHRERVVALADCALQVQSWTKADALELKRF